MRHLFFFLEKHFIWDGLCFISFEWVVSTEKLASESYLALSNLLLCVASTPKLERELNCITHHGILVTQNLFRIFLIVSKKNFFFFFFKNASTTKHSNHSSWRHPTQHTSTFIFAFEPSEKNSTSLLCLICLSTLTFSAAVGLTFLFIWPFFCHRVDACSKKEFDCSSTKKIWRFWTKDWSCSTVCVGVYLFELLHLDHLWPSSRYSR